MKPDLLRGAKRKATIRNRRFYGMTIGIGLICKGGVILASDSRTEDESGLKRFDLKKISEIQCGEIKCLIARSGTTVLSGRAVDLIQSRATDQSPQTVSNLLEIVRTSVAQVRRDFLASNPNLDYASPNGRFSLIVATYDGTPRLHIAEHNTAAVQPELGGKAYIGSGKILADYILSDVDMSDILPGEAGRAATYAVEVAKMRDSECEGPSLVAGITASGVIFQRKERTEESEKICREYEAKNQIEWVQSMFHWMRANRKKTDFKNET